MRLDEWQRSGREFFYRRQQIFYRDEERADAPYGPQDRRGEALVCLHGFPTASWDWHRLWPQLTARFRVVAADMLGLGFSAKPRDYAYSLHDQASLQEELLASLGIERAHVLAHDYGDSVAQELVARAEERRARGRGGLEFASVCFLNGGLFPETQRPLLIQRLLLSRLGPLVARFVTERRFRRSFSSIFGPESKPTEDELRDFWKLISWNDGVLVAPRVIQYMKERQANRARWVGILQTTKVPLRLIIGLEDPVSGAQVGERYRELVPDPDVVLLEGIGHYPQLEAPDGVHRAFVAFLDRIERQRTDSA